MRVSLDVFASNVKHPNDSRDGAHNVPKKSAADAARVLGLTNGETPFPFALHSLKICVTFCQIHWNSKETKSRSAIASETQGIVKTVIRIMKSIGSVFESDECKVIANRIRNPHIIFSVSPIDHPDA
jgi:hypothetical protein